MWHNIILITHVVIAASVVALVLLQQGKGADVGAAFGSGASSTVFGSRGSGSFLTRLTGILATLFFITSLTLAYLAAEAPKQKSILDTESAPATAIEMPADAGTGEAAGSATAPASTQPAQTREPEAGTEGAGSDVPVTD